MADPVWTYQYDVAKTPDANQLTQLFHQSPATVTAVTTGNPANRRVEIDATFGDAVFVSSVIPSLDSAVGATAEILVNIGGNAEGDGGMELTFLDRAFAILIYPSKLLVSICADQGGQVEHEIPTPSNNADILWRITYSPASGLRVYRNAVQIAGPFTPPVCTKPFQRVLFWVEGGAIATIKAVKFFVGGAVAP